MDPSKPEASPCKRLRQEDVVVDLLDAGDGDDDDAPAPHVLDGGGALASPSAPPSASACSASACSASSSASPSASASFTSASPSASAAASASSASPSASAAASASPSASSASTSTSTSSPSDPTGAVAPELYKLINVHPKSKEEHPYADYGSVTTTELDVDDEGRLIVRGYILVDGTEVPVEFVMGKLPQIDNVARNVDRNRFPKSTPPDYSKMPPGMLALANFSADAHGKTPKEFLDALAERVNKTISWLATWRAPTMHIVLMVLPFRGVTVKMLRKVVSKNYWVGFPEDEVPHERGEICDSHVAIFVVLIKALMENDTKMMIQAVEDARGNEDCQPDDAAFTTVAALAVTVPLSELCAMAMAANGFR